MTANFLPRAKRSSTIFTRSSTWKGRSGRQMPCAPPAMPDSSAIQPACRPMTSTTMTRWCDSAVVLRRSMASVATPTAVSKPKVRSVEEMSLSMVFGTPTTGIPASDEHPGRGERALAADRDERVDAVLRRQLRGVLGGFAQPAALQAGGAEDRAAAGEDAADRVEVERAVVAVEETLEPVLETDDFIAVPGQGAVHDRPDHCVQAGAVAACGENSDAHRAVSPARQWYM